MWDYCSRLEHEYVQLCMHHGVQYLYPGGNNAGQLFVKRCWVLIGTFNLMMFVWPVCLLNATYTMDFICNPGS